MNKYKLIFKKFREKSQNRSMFGRSMFRRLLYSIFCLKIGKFAFSPNRLCPKNWDFHRNSLHIRVPILSKPVYYDFQWWTSQQAIFLISWRLKYGYQHSWYFINLNVGSTAMFSASWLSHELIASLIFRYFCNSKLT